MWQQWTTQLHETEGAAGHFLSFAKRSREVHRHSAVTECHPAQSHHHFSSLSQYGEEFWEKLLRNPRDLSVDTLPSPAQLMGRRKKGGGRMHRGDAAAAFTQHIGDLRKKQSAIEEMKKERWWDPSPSYPPESSCSFEVENQTFPETLWSLDPCDPNPTHLNTGTVTPQMFGGYEEVIDLAPGGNPMMSFVVTGTAHREAPITWDTTYVATAFLDTSCLDTPCLDTPCLDMPCLDTPCLDMPCLDTPCLDTPCLHTHYKDMPCTSQAEFCGFPSLI
ncbi:uncharacterized protein Hap1MRO34_025621 [Clarias gariepinus]|uniref:uncharacterized protein LOC128517168 n=1 Tax=Clarias gariepinus TaxID=13013 RepID=UPI00234E1ECF|nr:uncharacterized protein LOC128517168 [Clarias gariepinus]